MRNATVSLRVVGVLALAAASVLAACGDDQDAPPTAEQMAAQLVTVDSFEGDWTINAGPDDGTDMTSGVVAEDQRDMLPAAELCDAASPEAQAAVEAVSWMAFRQLDLTEDDSIDPPTDRTGHMVFVQQFLTSGSADELAATFELLQSGSEEAGGSAEWRLHNAFVLDNDVLMSFLVVDIRAGDGVEPYYSTGDIDEMIAIAADSM